MIEQIVEERNEDNSVSSISQSASEPINNSSLGSIRPEASQRLPMQHKSSIVSQFLLPKQEVPEEVYEPRSAISSVLVLDKRPN